MFFLRLLWNFHILRIYYKNFLLRYYLYALLIGVAMLHGQLNAAPNEKNTIDQTRLKEIADRLAAKYRIPDYAIAFLNNDSLLFTLEKNSENAGKNYLIGSCAKSFTALAVMKLYDEGVIDIDQPVKNYLTWFEMKNPDYTRQVTVRHLLNHKSGFERQDGFFDVKTASVSQFEINMTSLLKELDTHAAPGTAFMYSNLNYVLLGLIINRVTGHPYAKYFSEYVLPATGMNNTYMSNTENYENNLIQPFQYTMFFIPTKSRNYYYSDFLVPAGYISSNITDVSRYIRFMLNKTVGDSGDTLISAESYNTLTGKGQTGYAMGWFRYQEDSLEVINHSGLNENFSSLFTFYPDLKAGWAILCNINSLEFCGMLDQEIKALVLNKTYPKSPVSFEHIMRWSTSIIPLLILIALIINFRRWSKNEFQFGALKGSGPNIRLVLAIVLSIILLFAVTGAFDMKMGKVIRFSPDIGWGLVVIAILGIMSGFARYFAKLTRD